MNITPISFTEANKFVLDNHRTHKPVVGHKFSIAASEGDRVHGVAIIGRPIARGLDDGWTLEVTRVCTDGTKNACSMLYGAAWRAVKAMGFTRLVTYTLQNESGSSLRGAGYKLIGETTGGNWNTRARPRIDTDHQQQKFRWEAA